MSHHPDKAGLSPLESEFRTLAEDYAGFRRSPDFVMHIDLPDEQALDDDISSYLQNEELWGFFNNCADSVHDGLNAAGAGLDDLNHDLIDRLSYPTELERQLRGIYWLEKNSVRDRTQ